MKGIKIVMVLNYNEVMNMVDLTESALIDQSDLKILNHLRINSRKTLTLIYLDSD